MDNYIKMGKTQWQLITTYAIFWYKNGRAHFTNNQAETFYPSRNKVKTAGNDKFFLCKDDQDLGLIAHAKGNTSSNKLYSIPCQGPD